MFYLVYLKQEKVTNDYLNCFCKAIAIVMCSIFNGRSAAMPSDLLNIHSYLS